MDKFAVDDEGKRPNICAVLHGNRKGKSKDIILNAHVDTVMVSELEKWHVDPFGGEEKDGLIYGRGANDMKGGVAAAIWAAKAIKESGDELGGDIILMLTSGEESCEGGTIGTRACVKRSAWMLWRRPCHLWSSFIGWKKNGTTDGKILQWVQAESRSTIRRELAHSISIRRSWKRAPILRQSQAV